MVVFLSLTLRAVAHDLDQLANSQNKKVVVDLVSVVLVLPSDVEVESLSVHEVTPIFILV
jgi:hypothetical protein